MPDNNKKLDLNAIDNDFLRDVQAATEQVKKRQADDKAKAVNEAKSAQSRKTSALLIAIGAVVVFLLSYWVVFGREGGAESDVAGTIGTPAQQSQAANGKVQPPCVNCAPTAPPAQGTIPAARSSKNVQHPPDGYEQPSDDPGM